MSCPVAGLQVKARKGGKREMKRREEDIIRIENLEVFAYHGVYSWEREEGQRFYINAALYVETGKAVQEDLLELSVDYGAVCHFMSRFMNENPCNLIETAAERLAAAVLLAFSPVRGITLEIRKPDAPIGLPFESVSAEISRRWSTAYLAMGSSLGDREAHIRNAVEAMEEEPKIRVKKVSELIPTAPYGGAAREEFLNGAMEIETLFTPEQLLDCLHALEEAAGRVRKERWADRTLDLDILLYEDLILWTERLAIPHPDMINREFVLKPLAQIAPYVLHPVCREPVRALLERLSGR
ncbi:MAG: 2-amino-4-hydroxy-6-hydroxymethyldihydropteridine diphosphokinase [Lachnospiraceae bacterium]|nr:2-amino-4-hydroxy-6-hydroxymethyldihydropteridine diphosphokinase [Lachnospiraceae bacterium]